MLAFAYKPLVSYHDPAFFTEFKSITIGNEFFTRYKKVYFL